MLKWAIQESNQCMLYTSPVTDKLLQALQTKCLILVENIQTHKFESNGCTW
jgi:hypothetical protein